MKRILQSIIVLLLFCIYARVYAQSQVVNNGDHTAPVSFPDPGCVYNWVNDNPAIGLPANGTGNIVSFIAKNTGNSPATATIKVRPATAGFAYLSNESSNTVSVINTATHTVIKSIPVGMQPWGIAASPDGSRVYVANNLSNTISVINTITNKVIATILVGKSPFGVVVSPDGTRVYVTNSNDPASISVIDAATNLTLAPMSIVPAPTGISISPDGGRLYVVCAAGGFHNLYVINTANNTLMSTILLEQGYTSGVVVSPDGKKVFVTNFDTNEIVVVDAVLNSVITSIPVDAAPYGETITPDGKFLYVSNEHARTVSVINIATNALELTIPVSGYPVGIATSTDGDQVYVASQSPSVINIINTISNTVVNQVSELGDPVALGNFIIAGVGCNTPPFTFTIKVNTSLPAISTTPVTGTISACAGSPSVNPNIQQFKVSGSNLLANITVAAPTGFEVSLMAGSGYGNSVSLVSSGAAVNNAVIYVRSSASATGDISGNLVLQSTGASNVNVAVKGVVSAIPGVNSVGNQNLFSGQNTNPVNFTGTANTFAWTNDKPGIGLPASGSGNIAAFTTINTGTSPIVATVTVTPKSDGLAYIANNGSGTMSVINTATKAVVASIPVGLSPLGVDASRDGSRIYVANGGSNNITVINTLNNTVITTIGVGTAPQCIAVSPDGNFVYVTNNISGTVTVINAATNAIKATVTVGFAPNSITISPDGSSLYVVNTGGNTISVINTSNLSVSAFNTENSPIDAVFSPDGSKLYVTNAVPGTVTVFNVADKSELTNISVGTQPWGISLSPDGSRAYVANTVDGTITVINTLTYGIVNTVNVGTYPLAVSVSSDGSQVYVTNQNSNNVSVINAADNTVLTTVPVERSPASLGNFVTRGIGCSGTPVKFTITVNAIPAVIVPGAVAGSISACAGSPSTSPNIQQFTVSGSGLTADVIAKSPPNFEISLTPGSGYGNSLILPQTGGGVSSKIIYVRSAAGASGNISGNVVLTSAGAAAKSVKVTGNVRGIPVADLPANQKLLTGSPTNAVNFTGNANTFTWINDTPSIGLPATGTGNIASFTAINTGSTPVIATVKVSPILAGIAYISNQGSNNISVINTLTNSVTATIPVGHNPYGVAVTPDGSQMYVINLADNNVSVINTANNTVIKTIPVGNGPNGITVSPDGTKVYVSNLNDNTISVISTTSKSVITTIPAGSGPYGLVLSPDGSRIYVTNYSSDKLSVIDAATYSIIATVNVGALPESVAVSPDGSKVYVVNNSDNSVVVIDAATNTFSKLITVGLFPVTIAISPDGSNAYVANAGANTVSVINTATNKVTGTINVGAVPNGVSFNSDGYLYVSNSGSNTVSVIDVTNNSLVGNIGVGTSPTSLGNFISKGTNCTGAPVTFTIEVDPSSAKIVAGPVSGKITACAGAVSVSPDVQQFTVSGSDLLGDIIASAPTGFQVSLNENSGYSSSVTLIQVAGSVNGTIVYVRAAANSAGGIGGSVILTSAGAVTQNVAVYGVISPIPTVNSVGNQTILAGSPTNAVNFTGAGNTFTWVNDTPAIGLAASGTGDIASFTAINNGSSPVVATITAYPTIAPYAYIANNSSNNVSVINTTTNKIIATIPVGNGPAGVAVSPDGSRVYVANSGSGTVSVINTTNNQWIGDVQVGQFPFGIVVSPDGSKVYVANYSSNFISVINTSNYVVEAQFYVDATPDALAISPDGSTLYISSFSTNTVDVVSTVYYGKIKSISTGSSPIGIAISHNGSLLYVANSAETYVSVIDVNTGTTITTILTGIYPNGISVSPDGSKVYVTSSGSGTVSVIDAATNTLKATVHVGSKPNGLSVSPDGSKVYITNPNAQNVSVINAADNTILTTIPVSTNPNSFGNFITNGSPCTGAAIKFTITVNTSTASITAGPVTGAIFACFGSPSVNPNLQEFNVSGSNLSADITATAPTGFEVSLTPASGFANSVTITQAGGSVAGTIVYVRSAASATGSIFGNVLLTSAGATVQKVAVTGVVNALPTVNLVTNQSYTNGQTTNVIPFTGSGSTFTWTNDTPGIGLAASGTGDLPVFTATNTGTSPVKATITVTPVPSGFAYVTNFGSNDVSVINLTTNKVITTVPVGANPIGVAVSPNGSRVYVSNQGSNSVSVINTADNIVASPIPVGSKPTGLAVSTDGSKVFVANSGDGTISVVNTANNAVTAIVSVGLQPTGVGVSPDGKFVYITNYEEGDVFVLDAATYAILSIISIGPNPLGIAVSPDGSKLCVGYGSQYLAIVKTATKMVSTRIPLNIEYPVDPRSIAVSPDGNIAYVADAQGYSIAIVNIGDIAPGIYGLAGLAESFPYGISVNADGSKLYAVNANGGVAVIDRINETSGSDVSAYIGVGLNPQTFGNFISNGTGCTGTPITFTITINATPVPLITATGTPSPVSTTYGTPSPSTSFTISGANLTAGILVTPPAGLEVSTDNVNFTNTITVGTSGSVAAQTVYLRLKSTTFVGTYPGKTKLTSAGATEVDVTTTNNIVNPAPLTITANNINKPLGATITGSSGAVEFTSQGLQNSETIGSITVAYGAGAESSAIAGTYIGSVVASAAAGGTFASTNYTITYLPGNIVIPAVAVASITYTGTLSALGTIYGTPSASTSFSVSGANLGSGILVTAPNGFEVSTDGFSFSNMVTIGVAGNISNTLVYLRLKAISPVDNYSDPVVLTSNGAPTVNVPTMLSTVSPALITIAAGTVTKTYGAALTDAASSANYTVSSGSLQNGEVISSVAIDYGTGADVSAVTGTYSGAVKPSSAVGTNGFIKTNYTITYLPADILVKKAVVIVTADNKSKIFGTANPELTITYSGFVNNEGTAQLSSLPVITTDAVTLSPVGKYLITVSGATAVNYSFNYIFGVLTVNQDIKLIVINNTFTPNGDGINDTWTIENLNSYTNNTVGIYNRYGEKVYSSVGYGTPWDGTFNGKPLPTGTYYYIINLKNGSKALSGWVAIIR